MEFVDAEGTSYEKIVVNETNNSKLIKIPFNEIKIRKECQPPGADLKKTFSLHLIQWVSFIPITGQGVTYFSECKLYQ